MLTLIRGTHLLAPENQGIQDVLIAAGTIIATRNGQGRLVLRRR